MSAIFNTPEPSPFRFEPRDMKEALMFSRAVVESGVVPHVKTAEAAFGLIAMGAELGLTAMQALRAIHLIDGKPTLSADLIVGLVKRSSLSAYFRLVDSTAEQATYETLREGEPEAVRYTYTRGDAQRSGLLRGRFWREHPAAMMRARCASALARLVYPDLVTGLIGGEDEFSYAASSLLTREAAMLKNELASAEVSAQTAAIAAQGELLPDGVPPRPISETPRRAKRAARAQSAERSDDSTLLRARQTRALELKGMNTREAARHVAARLTDRGLFETFSASMQALGAAVERFGVGRPHEANPEHILSAWLEIDSPVQSNDEAVAAA